MGQMENLAKELNKLVRTLVQLREKNICQACKKFVADGDPHHVVTKGMGAKHSHRRWDLLNIVLLCRPCHTKAHSHTRMFENLFKTEQPEIWNYLDKYRGGKPAKITLGEMEHLKSEFLKLEKYWRKHNGN